MKTDKVRFLGITFRSELHCAWFIDSTSFLAVLLVCAVAVLASATPKISSVLVVLLGIIAVFYHVSFAVAAVIYTKRGKMNGHIFSRDCIWFNALMAGVYIALCFGVIVIREFV